MVIIDSPLMVIMRLLTVISLPTSTITAIQL